MATSSRFHYLCYLQKSKLILESNQRPSLHVSASLVRHLHDKAIGSRAIVGIDELIEDLQVHSGAKVVDV